MFVIEDWLDEMDKIPKQTEIKLYFSEKGLQLMNELCRKYSEILTWNRNVQPAPPKFFRFLQSLF